MGPESRKSRALRKCEMSRIQFWVVLKGCRAGMASAFVPSNKAGSAKRFNQHALSFWLQHLIGFLCCWQWRRCAHGTRTQNWNFWILFSSTECQSCKCLALSCWLACNKTLFHFSGLLVLHPAITVRQLRTPALLDDSAYFFPSCDDTTYDVLATAMC